MPIITRSKFLKDSTSAEDVFTRSSEEPVPNAQVKPIQPRKKPSYGETLKAAFTQENIFGSIAAFGPPDRVIKDPNYDPFLQVEGTKYEKQADKFIYADSPEEVDRIKSQLDTEQKNKQILANSGWLGTVSVMAASVLDPTILIPGTAGIKAIKGVDTARRLGNIARGAGSGAGLGSTAIGIQESILHDTQLSRTGKESMLNMFFASAIGGLLGGTVGAISKGIRKSGEESLKTIDNNIAPKVRLDSENPGVSRKSLSAASRTIEDELFEEGIAFNTGQAINEIHELRRIISSIDDPKNPTRVAAKTKLDKKLATFKRRQKIGEAAFKQLSSPIEGLRSIKIRGLTSEFPTMRRVTNQLFESEFVTGKGLKGIVDEPVETKIKIAHAQVIQLRKNIAKSYSEYKSKLEPGRTKMSYSEFNRRIGAAMNKGDVDSIPQIQKISQDLRKSINKSLKEMQELEILPEKLDIKGAASYFPRKYNIAKIVRERDLFENILIDHFQQGSNLHKPLDSAAAQLKAEEVVDNILGRGDRQLAFDSMVDDFISSKGGKFTKARVLDVPYEKLEPWLDLQADNTISSYMVKAASLVESKKMLRRAGAESVLDLKRDMKVELDELIKANPKRRIALNKSFEKDLKLLDEFIGVATGSLRKTIKNQKVAEGLRTLRLYQTLNKLGGVLITSFAELGMAPFRQGFMRSITDGYLPFIRNFRKAKMSADQLKDFGHALELEQNSILRSMQEGDIGYGLDRSNYARFSEKVGDFFGKVSGLSGWTVLGKRVAGNVSSARIIRLMRKFSADGKIKDKDIRYLSSIGIGKNMYSRIHSQFKRFGDSDSGSFTGNFHKWSDTEAAETFASGIVRDVESVIITPGRGDIPLAIQKNDLLKNVFQFRSFSASATNKIFLAGIQKMSLGELSIPIAAHHLVISGYLVYATKQMLKDKEVKTDFRTVYMEGITRSGMLGLMFDYIHQLNPWVKSTRFAALQSWQSLLGPSASMAQEIYTGSTAFNDGRLTSTEARKLISLLPFQNLFYLRAIFDRLAPPKKKRKRKRQ
jgi:hypothetical protein